MGLMIATLIIISFIESNLLAMPNGGSIQIWIIVMIISFDIARRKNMFGKTKHEYYVATSVFTFSTIGILFVLGRFAYIAGINGFVLDYLIPYLIPLVFVPIIGLKIKYSLVLVALVAPTIIATSYVVSGVVVWKLNLWGSISYNAAYMIPTIITSVVIAIMYEIKKGEY